jgi:hypothetical protein
VEKAIRTKGEITSRKSFRDIFRRLGGLADPQRERMEAEAGGLRLASRALDHIVREVKENKTNMEKGPT